VYLKRIKEHDKSLFMANHEMLLSLYQKRKGVAIANLFDVEESVVVPEEGILVCDLVSKKRAGNHHQLEMSQPFSHIECN
jgi:hypothetical protein